MRVIAIIPARSGSKGLKDKNIKLFQGKPLIAWTIESAIESNIFDKIVVSTDSDYYKSIAEEYGADVPFLRSTNNSSDHASSWDVVREVLTELEHIEGIKYDVFCLLQPTSPLRTASDIVKAFDLMSAKCANSVVSVCEAEHPMSLYNKLGKDGSMDGFVREGEKYRRQDAEVYYRINGAIYFQNVDDVMRKKNICGKNSYAFVMDKRNSIDIDDVYDFMMAEALLKCDHR